MNSEELKNNKTCLNKELSLQDKKQQANLQSNSGLYFQIGLVASLFVIFAIFQLKIDKKVIVYNSKLIIETEELPTIIKDYIIEKEIINTPLPSKGIQQANTYIDDPFIVENVTPLPPVIESSTNEIIDTVIPKIDNIVVTDLPPVIDTIPISLVRDYPEFPGCDIFTSKQAKFDCFQQKIATHLQLNFNTNFASDYGIKGVQKVLISFTINHKGEVVNVMARAPNIILQKEAIKAINSLPIMKPAKQGFKKVNVTYSLPLVFKVN